MTARASVTLATLLLACAASGRQAHAEQLQRLHVTSLAISTDVARPATGQTFHITVALHVRESGVRFQTVQLPSFNGLDELGDERNSASGPRGTDYRETLTVVAHSAGSFRVSPASFDAIDAADGKPKRFISNSLTIVVGTSLVGSRTAGAAWVLAVLALGVAILAWRIVSRKRPQRVEHLPPAEPEQPASAQTANSDLRLALLALRDRRDRPSALLARSALWRAAGASPGETLADVLQRPAARVPQMRALLTSAERAAFLHDEDLAEAIARLVAEMEARV